MGIRLITPLRPAPCTNSDKIDGAAPVADGGSGDMAAAAAPAPEGRSLGLTLDRVRYWRASRLTNSRSHSSPLPPGGLTKKRSPNRLIVDEATNDDNSGASCPCV